MEMFHSGEWRRVAAHEWTLRSTAMVCRQLGCGSVIAATKGVSVTDEAERIVRVSCRDSHSVLRECSILSHTELNQPVGVKCSDSVKLVDGAGFCSGRLEVKTHQSWTSVCETDFNWQDAEVVCRELGCRAPLTLQGALFGEGLHLFSSIEFHCKGSENHLLSCSTSVREMKTCTHGSVVGLICSEPDDVRLVDGSSHCAGTVEMFHRGEWRKMSGDLWSITQAAVVCRQLDCGSAVVAAETQTKNENPLLTTCTGSEQALRECNFIHWFPSKFATVTCSDSVRLVDGAGLCSGRVEVKSHQSWTTVCEADFDWQDAKVVCRELDCGTPLRLQGALFGAGKHPFGSKDFQCNGTETRLLNCKTSTRQEQTCTRDNAVGLHCSGDNYLRLVDGSSRCAGIVEMFHRGEWRRLKEDQWGMTEAAVVCKQLKCGSAVAGTKRKTNEDKIEWALEVHCGVHDSEMRKCSIRNILQTNYHAGVICSGLLVQPSISFSTPINPSRGHQGSEVFRGHSFTITCSTQSQYPGGSFQLTLPWTNQSYTQAAVNHSASFFFPVADNHHQGNYICVYVNYVIIMTDDMFKVEGQYAPHQWNSRPFGHKFISESDTLSLTVIGNSSDQKGAAVYSENTKLVSLQPSGVEQKNVEGGAVEELHTVLEHQDRN